MPDSLLPMADENRPSTCCCGFGVGSWMSLVIVIAACMATALIGAQYVVLADDKPAASTAADSGTGEPKPDAEESADDEAKPEYVRIRKNERNLAVALETSVITFANSPKYPEATVDLIGAIHLGEPSYYEQLNELFKKYDVLLFEAVMPEEAVKEGLRPGHGVGSRRKPLSDEEQWTDAKIGFTAISALQLGMKDALGMEFQLSGVDYSAENFVHADMTAEEFESSMSRRGESFSGMFLNEMGKSVMSQQDQDPIAMNLDVLLSALSSDRAYRIRRIAAVQLAKAGAGDAFAGFDGSSTIITERNKRCLEIMAREIRSGHRKVGIFYGAGHFADMEKRMAGEYGFQRTGEEWLIAWHLRDPKKEAKAAAEKKSEQ